MSCSRCVRSASSVRAVPLRPTEARTRTAGCAGAGTGQPPVFRDQRECWLRDRRSARRSPSLFRANTGAGASAQNTALGFYDTIQDAQHAFQNAGCTLGLNGTQRSFGNLAVTLTRPCDPRRLPNRGAGRKPSVFRCCTDSCAAQQNVELGFYDALPSPQQRSVDRGTAGLGGANVAKTYGNLAVKWSYRSALH